MNVKDLVKISISTSLISVVAPLSIPIGPIPITLQTLIISIIGILIGGKKGFIATTMYIGIGAIGIPVFAQYKSGLSVLISPTGGFIISFPIMVFIIGIVFEKYKNKIILYIGVILANIINYVTGLCWFLYITNTGLVNGIKLIVIPFMLTTAIKVILTVEIGQILKNRLQNII